MSLLSHIDHIAIAVTNIKEAVEFYTKLGLSVNKIEEMPERGIRTAFIQVGSTMLELMEPLNNSSEISSFLEKRGPGLHHIAFKTNNINSSIKNLQENNIKLIYNQNQKGAHNTQINFIHPKSAQGVLIELVGD